MRSANLFRRRATEDEFILQGISPKEVPFCFVKKNHKKFSNFLKKPIDKKQRTLYYNRWLAKANQYFDVEVSKH